MFISSIYTEKLLIDINKLIENKNNFDDYILESLKKKLGNKCNSDGLIIKDTIQIINRNSGSFNLNEKLLYNITFKCDILYPNEGSILHNCEIIFNSDILYIAQLKRFNLIIIIPKIFLNNNIQLQKKSTIDIICLSKYYELNDSYLFIIGIPNNNNNLDNSINISSTNDLNCKNIIENITSLKNEYYNLFHENKITEDKDTLIDYNLYEFNNTQLNKNLIDFKSELLDYIISSYNIDTKEFNNINNINDIYNLLDILHIHRNNNIFINFKNSIFNNFDDYSYSTNKDSNLYSNLFKSDESQINNSSNYCYIISSLQLLKNCKLFLKHLKTLDISNFSQIKTKIYNELLQLLLYSKNNLNDFINLLTEYITTNDLNWNLNHLNDTNDFIYLLFNIISSINITSFKKNIYTNINNDYIDFPQPIEEFDDLSIKEIILKLKQTYNNDLLKYFYNIKVSHCKCSKCGFEYYDIYNYIIHTLFSNNSSHSITELFNNDLNNYQHIPSLKCNICSNTTLYKNTNIYISDINYLLLSINRYDFSSLSLNKNTNKISYDSRININNIDIDNIYNTLNFKNSIIDFKSLIIQNGSINNGHYITINKDKSNIFNLYDDHNKYKLPFNDLNNNNQFKEYSHLYVYQNNTIHDLPLSDISLLQYEHNILNDYNDTITKYISNKVNVGVHLGGFKGGTLFESLYFINYLQLNYNKIINIDDFSNILNDFFNIYFTKFDNYYYEYNKSKNKNNFIKEFITNIQSDLQEYDKYFYYYFILKIVKQIEQSFNPTNQIEFISNIDLLDNTNIYIGSAGYDTSETNYWDIIYQKTPNNLELYSTHLNSIEINHFYYNDYLPEHFIKVNDKIKQLSYNLSLSIIFNKELSDFITNSTQKLSFESIKTIFDKYFINKLTYIIDYLHNIIFKFESHFDYNEINFHNIQLFSQLYNIPELSKINIIFEFYNISWYNQQNVIEYFIENNLNMTTLIFNNDNHRFGDSLNSNLYSISNSQLLYSNYNFNINYIKLYGSIEKYSGSHIKEIPYLIKNIKDKLNINLLDKIPISSLNTKQYIYFNNLETDKDNNKYNSNDENTLIPSAVYDAKVFYKLLEQTNIN